MLTDYINGAMHRAQYKILPDDGTFFGNIPGFEGQWSNASSLEAARDDLEEVLEEWIRFRVSKNLPLPEVDGIKLEFKEAV